MPLRGVGQKREEKVNDIILKRYVVGPLAVNAFLIGCPDTKKAFYVDPAGSEEMLVNEAEELGLELTAIVNTHGHPDHTSGNRRMKELTGVPCLMHRDDDTLFRTPEAVTMFRSWGFDVFPPADGYLDENEPFVCGNLHFKVIHTPGHSPGSVCLYGHGVVITGDTLFVGAVGRADLPGGSFETLMNSIKTKLLLLPDETIVLPGHDYGDAPTSTIKREKETNPYILQYC